LELTMLLVFAVGIIVAACVAVVVWRRWSTGRIKPTMPDVTMDQVMQLVLSGSFSPNEHVARIIDLHGRACSNWAEESTAFLLGVEKEALAARSPLRPIRTAIMDAMDAAAFNQAQIRSWQGYASKPSFAARCFGRTRF
jgi:uncharacterized membrane protein YccC